MKNINTLTTQVIEEIQSNFFLPNKIMLSHFEMLKDEDLVYNNLFQNFKNQFTNLFQISSEIKEKEPKFILHNDITISIEENFAEHIKDIGIQYFNLEPRLSELFGNIIASEQIDFTNEDDIEQKTQILFDVVQSSYIIEKLLNHELEKLGIYPVEALKNTNTQLVSFFPKMINLTKQVHGFTIDCDYLRDKFNHFHLQVICDQKSFLEGYKNIGHINHSQTVANIDVKEFIKYVADEAASLLLANNGFNLLAQHPNKFLTLKDENIEMKSSNNLIEDSIKGKLVNKICYDNEKLGNKLINKLSNDPDFNIRVIFNKNLITDDSEFTMRFKFLEEYTKDNDYGATIQYVNDKNEENTFLLQHLKETLNSNQLKNN